MSRLPADADGIPPRLSVTVAIPTYNRGRVLLDTVNALLELEDAPAEMLLLDQTLAPEAAVEQQLSEWAASGRIRWLRLARPSIPAAMNRGLLEAQSPIVLFLDDDIVPYAGLITAHRGNYADETLVAVAGSVLQPGQQPNATPLPIRTKGIRRDFTFPFNGTTRAEVANCMAGNLSVRRERALVAGGFDENFVGVGYRFETEFCRRLLRAGGRMVFEPTATIQHLQAPHGGTRSYGHHLTSARPEHSVGDYYFALREARGAELAGYVGWRMLREVRTRFHLRHPWWIPVKLLGELRGLFWALQLTRQGPSWLPTGSADSALHSVAAQAASPGWLPSTEP